MGWKLLNLKQILKPPKYIQKLNLYSWAVLYLFCWAMGVSMNILEKIDQVMMIQESTFWEHDAQ